jgi:hypothetical protein
LNEERGNDGKPARHSDVIELQLADTNANGTRAAYNRAPYWPDRVRLMQHWADGPDRLRDGAQVVALSRRTSVDVRRKAEKRRSKPCQWERSIL